MEYPILTVIVPVYNHEKYVLQAIKSIEKQNIKYTYEVIIGDDCSTDNSRGILQEYQKSAPDNFCFIYRKINCGMLKNISDLFYRSKGKYIIVLEADDYWLYENKINEQITFLETNIEFSGYAHRVQVIDSQGNKCTEKYEAEKGEGIYDLSDYLKGLLPGQTASFMYRNYFRNRESNLFEYLGNNTLYPLDRFISFVVASEGKIYCTDAVWSAYRYITHGGSSFSANIDSTNAAYAKSALDYHRSLYKYSVEKNKQANSIKVSEKLYFKSFLRDWAQCGDKRISVVLNELRQARFPLQTLIWIGAQYINQVLRGKVYQNEK